jgi:hypothetical protein
MPANTVDTGVIINGETARFSEMSWEGRLPAAMSVFCAAPRRASILLAQRV